MLSRLERGELAFSMNHHGLEDFECKLQRMVNRLALSILLAAVILSLAMLMLVFHPSGREQYGGWVFAFAFLLVLGFGAWLM